MALKHVNEEIKISADVLDPERCRFTVNRPVLPIGGSVQFTSPEKAKGSPLAHKLFGIENVTAVMIEGDTVTIGWKGTGDWTEIGKKIGNVVRTFLQSEAANIASAVSKGTPDDAGPEDQMKVKIQNVLDTYINPGVEGHGGHVTLLDVKGTVAYIKMGGGCQGCGMASVTLKQGIERSIRQYVPEVTEILDSTDHASGKNPFYAPSSK